MQIDEGTREETRRLLRRLASSEPEQPSQSTSSLPAKKRWSWIFVSVMGVAVVAVVAGAYISREPRENRRGTDTVSQPPSVSSTQPAAPGQQSRVSSVLDAAGHVVATRQATVSAETTGRIVRLHVAEGSQVRQGDIIAELDSRIAAAQVSHADSRVAAALRMSNVTRAKLEAARRNSKRARELAAEGYISKSSVDETLDTQTALQAQLAADISEVDVAQKLLALQRQELANVRILAPFDGVVTALAARVGEIVSPISAGGGFTRTGICTIVDLSSLEGEVEINEQYLRRVYEGQPVTIAAPAYPGLKLKGHLIMITPTVDRSTAAVKIRLAFDERAPELIPDLRIDVAFAPSQSHSSPVVK